MSDKHKSSEQRWLATSGLLDKGGVTPTYDEVAMPQLKAVYFPENPSHGSIPWRSGQRVLAASVTWANEYSAAEVRDLMLTRLTWGAELIVLQIEEGSTTDWREAFHEIDLSMISIELRGRYDRAGLATYLDIQYPKVRLNVSHDADLYDVHCSAQLGVEEVVVKIADQLSTYVLNDDHPSWDHVRIILPAQKDFLLQIAMIRSVQLVVHALKDKGWAAHDGYPRLRLHVIAGDGDVGLETYIGRSSKVLSGALTGVDEIMIDPDVDLELDLSPGDKVRIGQHLHWLLAYESGLHDALDRTHGSHFIESATEQLFEHAWSQCLQRLNK